MSVRWSMKFVIGLTLFVAAAFIGAAQSSASGPPIENLSPASGSVLPYGTNLNPGPLRFTCPTLTEPGAVLPVSPMDYSVRVATSPEPGPNGLLAVAYTVAIGNGAPTNAQETECRDSQTPQVLPPGTYYWQVSRSYFEQGLHELTGPVWSFTVQAAPEPPAIPPRAEGRAGYSAYIACGLGRQAPQAFTCPRRSKIGAFFRSPTDVLYTICVRFPTGRSLCLAQQEGAAGTLYVNKITSSLPGKYKVTWMLPGRRITRYFRRPPN